ncbi:MAG TPA: transporter substrate-binding domain-containing protein, partial [Acidimicrobiales bacterium]
GRGVLRVGSSVDRPPLLFYGTGTTVPEGIEWDLLQSMGRQLGVSVSVVNLPLGALGPDLVGGKIDMFVSGVADLKPLEGAGIDFVDYFTGRTAVLVRQGNPVRITGADDLCGRQVGVVAETAQQVAAAGLGSACRSRGRPAPVLRVVADHASLVALLVSGRVQADLDDAVVAAYTAQGSSGPATMEAVGTAVDPVPYGIGVLHSDPQLTAAIQAAVRSMIADGEYDEILGRWGGETSALHTAAVDAGPSGL